MSRPTPASPGPNETCPRANVTPVVGSRVAAELLRDLGAPTGARARTQGELTAREQEVLGLVALGMSNAKIAQTLFISEKTVSVHVSNILRKTETGSRREVAALARRVGWGTGG